MYLLAGSDPGAARLLVIGEESCVSDALSCTSAILAVGCGDAKGIRDPGCEDFRGISAAGGMACGCEERLGFCTPALLPPTTAAEGAEGAAAWAVLCATGTDVGAVLLVACTVTGTVLLGTGAAAGTGLCVTVTGAGLCGTVTGIFLLASAVGFAAGALWCGDRATTGSGAGTAAAGAGVGRAVALVACFACAGRAEGAG